jgi:DNA-binding FadR family transcriptional regulator
MRLLPVKKENLTSIVTEKIRQEVLGGGYKPGDRLPAEREFVEQLKVSRIVVREALRKLEANGLLVMKRGSGMFVADVGSSAVYDSFISALKVQKVDVVEITKARLILEPVVAEVAAKNMTPQYLDALGANIKKVQSLIANNQSAHDANIDFHGLLAEATQNRVIRLSMEAVLQFMRDLLRPRQDQLTTHTVALSWHERILSAIEKRQPKKVARLMQDHIVEHTKNLSHRKE